MNRKKIYKHLPVILVVFGIISFAWWFVFNPADNLIKKMPGKDKRPAGALKNASVNFGAYYQKFDGTASSLKGSWPNFRGGNWDNICNDNIPLADSWGKAGPKVLWSVDLGEGHSGPIISDGKVYVFDYDETRRADVLRCFSFEDGKEIWRVGYDIYLKRNHGISRTVPAIKGKNVVTIGPNCQIMCVNADSGKVNWGIDLARDFETEVPLWYTGQCPMIDDSLVIVGVGGKSLVTAFSLKTGKVVWETPNPNKWKMSHSSIIKFNLGEEKIYLYAALGGVTGVSSEGKVLFETTLFNHTVVAPTPVYLGNGRVFLTAGYGAGSSTIKIEKTASGYTVKGLQKIQPTEGMASEQQTPILYNGLIYSIQPKDAGSLRNQFVCFDPADITKLIWSSGKTKRYGLGPYILADNKMFILSDEGELSMLSMKANKFTELAKFQILDGVDAWGPMAIADGRLLARDSRKMVCIDLR